MILWDICTKCLSEKNMPMAYVSVEQTFSTKGHIENFAATGDRVYYIYIIVSKDLTKTFLH